MIRQSKVTTREISGDNVEYTLAQLKKLHPDWRFSHTKHGYNYYILTVSE